MYCKNCGKEIPSEVKFCRYCGVSLASPKRPVKKKRSEKKKPARSRKKRPVFWAVFLVVCVVITGGILFAQDQWEPITANELPKQTKKAASTDHDQETESSEHEDKSEYIFADSHKRQISVDELAALSPRDLRIARNEILARHGRIFLDQELKDHFNRTSWYEGTISPKTFDKKYTRKLNRYELSNIETIRKAEENHK